MRREILDLKLRTTGRLARLSSMFLRPVFALAVPLCMTLSPSAAGAQGAPKSYVAMGSSYAAGPGVGTSADQPPNRCARSSSNYAHQIAQRLDLNLTDVSCSGATTVNVLEPWGELPAQVAAVSPDTALVTITVGGNDLNYVGNLYAASCAFVSSTKAGTTGVHCPAVTNPSAADYEKLRLHLRKIVQEIRKRSPRARVVFVEYPATLPDGPLCSMTPMANKDALALRTAAQRLAEVTEAAAAEEGSEVIEFAKLSRKHDPCSDVPWMSGYFDRAGHYVRVAYHPNLAGMTAMADAVIKRLKDQNKSE